MNYSQLRFRISAKRDFETLLAFAKEAVYHSGRNLNWVCLEAQFKIESSNVWRTFPIDCFSYRGKSFARSLCNNSASTIPSRSI